MVSDKQQKMFGIIKEWKNNDLTISELCKKHNITKDSFSYWNKKYNKIQNNKSVSNKVEFIPLKILQPQIAKNLLTIVFPNQVSVIIENSEDINLVKKLINLI